ncbi:MAG TPA: response regulator transcription factor [Saprospiraceae bacterium]|nr:response regulator transcription factor [Saprospiraceae bacterium]
MTSDLVKILIVDDHDIVHSGLKVSITKTNIPAELTKAKNGEDAVKCIRSQQYDLIILDVNLPDTDTQSLMKLFLNSNPKQKVLVFTMSSEEVYARRFLKLGAKGFVSKTAEMDEVIKAILIILEGKKYITQKLAELLSDDLMEGFTERSLDILTDREMEIMQLLIKGLGGKEISNQLSLHPSTTATYKARLFQKLGVNNVLELREVVEFYKK